MSFLHQLLNRLIMEEWPLWDEDQPLAEEGRECDHTQNGLKAILDLTTTRKKTQKSVINASVLNPTFQLSPVAFVIRYMIILPDYVTWANGRKIPRHRKISMQAQEMLGQQKRADRWGEEKRIQKKMGEEQLDKAFLTFLIHRPWCQQEQLYEPTAPEPFIWI